MSIDKNEKSHQCYDSIIARAHIIKKLEKPYAMLGWRVNIVHDAFDDGCGIYKVIYCPYCGKELDCD